MRLEPGWRQMSRHPVTDRVLEEINDQLTRTAHVLGRDPHHPPFGVVSERSREYLARIAEHANAGRLSWEVPLRTDLRQGPVEPVHRVVRLGVLAVNGNPMHWGHLLTALQAMAELVLDRFVFVVQGIDNRKLAVSQTTQAHRHRMARQVIQVLDPLATYSSLGWGNESVGEDHVVTLLRLNPLQRIRAWYLVGTDHYQRFDARGDPDTLLRLERNLGRADLDPTIHQLEVAFVDRGERGPVVSTSLSVQFLPEVVPASSTAIRMGETAYAPFAAYRYIRDHREYATAIGLDHLADAGRQPS